MCGRFTIIKKVSEIAKRFGTKAPTTDAKLKPNYNAAPLQHLPVITLDEPDVINFYQWGLIPHWAQDRVIGHKLINAKAETLLEKPAFKSLVARKRCLVVADGFYEWGKKGTHKQPMRIVMADGSLFAIAGLWDEWRSENGQLLRSFTIITTIPHPVVKPIHERMPAILRPADEQKWLDPNTSENNLMQMLRIDETLALKAYPVSKAVNSPTHNSPDLIEPVQEFTGYTLPLFDKPDSAGA